MVADPLEGTKRIGGNIDELTTESLKNYPALNPLINVTATSRATNPRLDNIFISCEDIYTFSCSSEFSIELHQQWRAQEGYDACYQIRSPDAFFFAISQAICESGVFLGYRDIIYYDNNTDLDVHSPIAGLHPACLKGGENFGFQAEVRAFWRALSGGTIHPLIVNASDAIEHCDRHRVLS